MVLIVNFFDKHDKKVWVVYTRGMGMKDAGAYLRHLRKRHGLTQGDVARAIGVTARQVWRWEQGETEPLASALAKYARLVTGSPGHVFRLLLEGGFNEGDAEILAEAQLNRVRSTSLPEPEMEATDSDVMRITMHVGDDEEADHFQPVNFDVIRKQLHDLHENVIFLSAAQNRMTSLPGAVIGFVSDGDTPKQSDEPPRGEPRKRVKRSRPPEEEQPPTDDA